MSDTSSDAPLKKTPLHAAHVALGARMVPFGGWDMPVEYSGITAEHLAVRTARRAVRRRHMGEIEIAGKDALAAVQRITSQRRRRSCRSGRRSTPALTTPEGTFVDDLLVYRFGADALPAGRQRRRTSTKDYAWIADARAGGGRRRRRQLERPLRADRRAGPDGARRSCSR